MKRRKDGDSRVRRVAERAESAEERGPSCARMDKAEPYPTGRAIGFIGFGEAGFYIAKGLREAGAGEVVAYDLHTYTPGKGELIRRRAESASVCLVESNAELAARCGVLLSTVTPDQACIAAERTAPHLRADHLYADLNSVSPDAKQRVARTVEASGARFVELAIMAPVPPHGHRVPMLAGGEAAGEFVQRMGPLGLRVEVVSGEVGVAAATKMFRSIVVKGLEALLTECVLGAARYGAEERVFASLADLLPGVDWSKLAGYMAGRVAVHGERRAREMEEVAATLLGIGIEPIMADATARRMDWAAKLDLKARFGGEAPADYREFVRAVEEAEREQKSPS
jgi:3-hydroxyisobutyrate dehydrogenase-like beta-hydroxyacid dehydrogenase